MIWLSLILFFEANLCHDEYKIRQDTTAILVTWEHSPVIIEALASSSSPEVQNRIKAVAKIWNPAIRAGLKCYRCPASHDRDLYVMEDYSDVVITAFLDKKGNDVSGKYIMSRDQFRMYLRGCAEMKLQRRK